MNPLKQINIFIDSVFETIIDFDNSLILDIINNIDVNESRVISNRGGWQSLSHTLGKYLIIDELFKFKIYPYVEAVLDKYKINIDHKKLTFNYWININRKYNYNRLHDHSNSILSGVYYIKVPQNSGEIIFHKESKCNDLDISEYNIYNSNIYTFPLKENTLILFNSFLKHEVTQNLTEELDDRRISIAFDLVETNISSQAE